MVWRRSGVGVRSFSDMDGTLVEVTRSEILAYHVVAPGSVGNHLWREAGDLSAAQTTTSTAGGELLISAPPAGAADLSGLMMTVIEEKGHVGCPT